MAKRLTEEDISNIQELYKSLGTYAAVSRELGFSPSTVKKYVELGVKTKINTMSIEQEEAPNFKGVISPIEIISLPKSQKEWSAWCELSEQETQDILNFSSKLIS